MNPSKVLVVLPTLGTRIDTLKLTLESIQLQSTQVDLRLVVVCPQTAVDAISLAKEFGAEIVADPSNGISTAINSGVLKHRGEKYYAWMGDDDLFRPNGLATLVDNAEKHDALVSFGACDYIDPEGNIIATNKAGNLATWILSWGPDLIPHPGSIIRMKELLQSGLFSSELKYAMDLDMFLRMKKLGKFIGTKQVVSAFRWHPESLTVSNRKASSQESEKVKQKHLNPWLKIISWMWVRPIRFASRLAANNLNSKAKKNIHK